jgi:hypothetical protein
MKGLVKPAVFVALSTFSAPLRSESYLVVNLGTPSSDPVPTYLAVETPRRDWRSRTTKEFTHLTLDGPLTLMRLISGRYGLSHFDFTKTPRGDQRTAYFQPDWKIQIHANAVHYLGPKSFDPSDPTQADTVMTLELLCGSFPLEVSELREFHFLRYGQVSTPIKYSCKPSTD